MEYQQEPLDLALQDEIIRLLDDYYDTTEAHVGLPGPYDFNWNMYYGMQQNDMLVIVTARDGADRALQGVVIYIIVPHPHHRTHLQAYCDSLSVAKDARGQGLGSELMRTAEPLLEAAGAKTVIHTMRVVYDAEPLFIRHGYKLAEQIYMKDL